MARAWTRGRVRRGCRLFDPEENKEGLSSDTLTQDSRTNKRQLKENEGKTRCYTRIRLTSPSSYFAVSKPVGREISTYVSRPRKGLTSAEVVSNSLSTYGLHMNTDATRMPSLVIELLLHLTNPSPTLFPPYRQSVILFGRSPDSSREHRYEKPRISFPPVRALSPRLILPRGLSLS